MNFASGATAAVGLMAAEGPPLSPTTIGRSPAIIDAGATVPLRSFEAILAERSGEAAAPAEPAPAELPPGEMPPAEMPPAAHAEAPAATELRRVVLKLVGGEELELGSYDTRDAAVSAAQALIATFTAAEAGDDWPELDGRFVRPASVLSIDVLVAA